MKSSVKTSFFCRNCGTESPKWVGRCNACGEWNSYVEEVISRPKAKGNGTLSASPVTLSDIQLDGTQRIVFTDEEFNRVLGGGIVPGSIVLVAGDPGIGKSTLLLQLALSMPSLKSLYVTGEESPGQLKLRAQRLGTAHDNCLILAETSLDNVFHYSKNIKPGLIIIDTIQTLQSGAFDAPAGSISQVRECAGELQRFAKETNTPVIVIGHINKDGAVAGPKILEHIVDVVLQFEGDRHYAYRIVRTLKNRFGSTSELGIYEMTSAGLRQVSNPSEILISQKSQALPGTAIAAVMEGMRPLMVEAQSLVTPSVYSAPQRSSTGFDLRRLGMLLAVLEKRCGFKFGNRDVFLNIAGGLRIDDPSADLAVACALLSSFHDIPVPHEFCFAGETGLSGEIRPVSQVGRRIAEAGRLGFSRIFISSHSNFEKEKDLTIEIVSASKVDDLFSILFG